MDYTNTIIQLNQYPRERYNVLVPVTTMQVASNLQRITVSEVQLDTRQDNTNKGPSKDIYFEKSSGAFAITKVGGMKLAAAANISIVDTTPGRTEGCQRCIEMARATGKPRVCGNCEHVHDVAVTVTIRVPEPSGGFRLMKATREIDCTCLTVPLWRKARRLCGPSGRPWALPEPTRWKTCESRLSWPASFRTWTRRKSNRPWPVAISSLWGCSLKCPPRRRRQAYRRRPPPRMSLPMRTNSPDNSRGTKHRRNRRATLGTGRLSRSPRKVSTVRAVGGKSPGGTGRRRTSRGTVSAPLAVSCALSAKSGRKEGRGDERH